VDLFDLAGHPSGWHTDLVDRTIRDVDEIAVAQDLGTPDREVDVGSNIRADAADTPPVPDAFVDQFHMDWALGLGDLGERLDHVEVVAGLARVRPVWKRLARADLVLSGPTRRH